jgi:hypothetical protein
VLEEMRVLVERLPLPHPFWHQFVPEMDVVVIDARAAIDALASLPQAATQLLRQIEEHADHPDDQAAGPTIAAARARLRALPVPQGEHPYLDEILLALEAAQAALGALAATGAEDAFRKSLQQIDAASGGVAT